MHTVCYTMLKTRMPKPSHMLSTASSLLMNTILCVVREVKLYLLYIYTHILKTQWKMEKKGKRLKALAA